MTPMKPGVRLYFMNSNHSALSLEISESNCYILDAILDAANGLSTTAPLCLAFELVSSGLCQFGD